MNTTFTNLSVVSADDLRTALGACRQLRHVSPDDCEKVVAFFFGDIEHSLAEQRKLPGTGRFFVRAQEAFEEAVSTHGASCDICGGKSTVEERKWRWAAQRMLENLDGFVKLMLCPTCSTRFARFCSRHFKRETRIPWSTELEQMMLAFIADEVGREARRVLSGNPPRKRANERPAGSHHRRDRTAIPERRNDTGNLQLDWRQQEHG